MMKTDNSKFGPTSRIRNFHGVAEFLARWPRGTGLNNLQSPMKTIPVSLIVAGILAPVVSFAQPEVRRQGPPPRGGPGDRGGDRAFMERWKSADTDKDGSISRAEFDAISRLQGLPEEKRAHLFERLDKNSDGKLDRQEMGRMGKPRDGQGPPMLRLWELDIDKSGGVSFEEFQAGRFFKKLDPEKQRALFRRLDTNGDGVITPQDKPEPAFKRDGGKPRPQRPDRGKPDGPGMEPRQIIRQLDQDNDGALTFEEFRVGPAVRGLSEDEQEDRFEALDKNGDLKITSGDFAPRAPDKPKRPRPHSPPADAE
jgi:Ca2+-binding EF-hand superfamily protein